MHKDFSRFKELQWAGEKEKEKEKNWKVYVNWTAKLLIPVLCFNTVIIKLSSCANPLNLQLIMSLSHNLLSMSTLSAACSLQS